MKPKRTIDKYSALVNDMHAEVLGRTGLSIPSLVLTLKVLNYWLSDFLVLGPFLLP
jgi:hypothetical protein